MAMAAPSRASYAARASPNPSPGDRRSLQREDKSISSRESMIGQPVAVDPVAPRTTAWPPSTSA
jgi:hypothetical protein